MYPVSTLYDFHLSSGRTIFGAVGSPLPMDTNLQGVVSTIRSNWLLVDYQVRNLLKIFRACSVWVSCAMLFQNASRYMIRGSLEYPLPKSIWATGPWTQNSLPFFIVTIRGDGHSSIQEQRSSRLIFWVVHESCSVQLEMVRRRNAENQAHNISTQFCTLARCAYEHDEEMQSTCICSRQRVWTGCRLISINDCDMPCCRDGKRIQQVADLQYMLHD
jgi:hypothetical protein